eukprot:UN25646
MIFICCSEEAEDLTKQLGQLNNNFLNFPLDEMEIKGVQEYNLDVDWKLLAENFMEWYHVGPVHPALAKFSTMDKHIMNEGDGLYTGFVTHPVTNSGGPADTSNFNPTPKSNEYENQTAFFYHIFPNVSVTVYPHSVYTLVMTPTTAGKCKETLYLLQHPDCRLKTDTDEECKRKTDDLFDFVCQVNNEDVWIVNRVAKGLKNSQYRGGRFSPEMEQACYRFQNMVADALTSMSPGVYPPNVIDYYKAFPHMKKDYVNPTEEMFEETSSHAELLNIGGTTSEEAEATPETTAAFTVVEIDPVSDTITPLVEVTTEGEVNI